MYLEHRNTHFLTVCVQCAATYLLDNRTKRCKNIHRTPERYKIRVPVSQGNRGNKKTTCTDPQTSNNLILTATYIWGIQNFKNNRACLSGLCVYLQNRRIPTTVSLYFTGKHDISYTQYLQCIFEKNKYNYFQKYKGFAHSKSNCLFLLSETIHRWRKVVFFLVSELHRLNGVALNGPV